LILLILVNSPRIIVCDYSSRARVNPMIEDVRHAIDGGESKTYTFTIPEDEEAGLHWYHNHVHGITAQSYLSSLFGAFIIEGTDSDITKSPGVEGATEVIMILSEGYVNEDKTVPPDGVPMFNAAEDWDAVVNGQLWSETKYEFNQGEAVLFRAISATSYPTISLAIPSSNVTFVVLAYDGLPTPEPEEVQVVDVEPGGRVDFLARFDAPGNYTMTRLAKPGPFPTITWDIEKVVATITVNPVDTDVPADPLIDGVELPEYSDNLKALAEIESVDTKTIALQMKIGFPLFQILKPQVEQVPGDAFGFGINDRLSTPAHANGRVAAGTCETWTVLTGNHPFHIHAARMLVTHIDGIKVDAPFWRDTMAAPVNMTVHVCFDAVQPGDHFLAHCHQAQHIDGGMVAMFDVAAAEIPENPTATPIAGGPAVVLVTGSPMTAPIAGNPTAEPITESPMAVLVVGSPTAVPIKGSPLAAPVSAESSSFDAVAMNTPESPTATLIAGSLTTAPITGSPMTASVVGSPTAAPTKGSPTAEPVSAASSVRLVVSIILLVISVLW